MIWSPSRQLLFVHIPKTGGTSIEAAYEPHILFGDIMLAARRLGIDVAYEKHLRVGKHSPAIRIARLMGMAEFRRTYSFAVVRDPVSRMESYFRWIHSYAHKGAQERELSEIKDFEAFVARVHPRFSPQVSFVNHPQTGERLVTLLIPFTRLSEGWARVCARYGIDHPLPRVNASKAGAAEVTEAGRAMVREVYAADVELVAAVEAEFAKMAPATAADGAHQAAE